VIFNRPLADSQLGGVGIAGASGQHHHQNLALAMRHAPPDYFRTGLRALPQISGLPRFRLARGGQTGPPPPTRTFAGATLACDPVLAFPRCLTPPGCGGDKLVTDALRLCIRTA
jgi:hypothetical protein